MEFVIFFDKKTGIAFVFYLNNLLFSFVAERASKLPTTKQSIGDLSSLINDPDIDDRKYN